MIHADIFLTRRFLGHLFFGGPCSLQSPHFRMKRKARAAWWRENRVHVLKWSMGHTGEKENDFFLKSNF